MEGGVSPPVRLSAQSTVSRRSDVPFRESFLQQMHSVENPGEACHGWNSVWGGGASVQEHWGNASYFDIPTMPFKAVNFHFRGRSMCVTLH